MCWIFLRNVRCKMLRSLTQFDGNTHGLPIRLGRSRNLFGVKRAIVLSKLASYSLTSVSNKLLKTRVVDQGAEELNASSF